MDTPVDFSQAEEQKDIGLSSRIRRAVEEGLKPTEYLNLDYVTVHGVQRITSSFLSWPRRLVWLMLLLSGLAGMLYLSSHEVLLYHSWPIRVQVSTVNNGTISLPAISICLRQKYDPNNMLKLWREHHMGGKFPSDADMQLLARTNLTLSEIWQRAGYALKDIVKLCFAGPGGDCDAKGVWSPVLTRFGLCYTYSGASATMGGKLFGVYLRLGYRGNPYGEQFGGYAIAVHNPLEPVTQAIENGFTCTQKITKDNKKLGCHLLVFVTVQKIKLINRREHKCSPYPRYSTEHCRSTCLYRHVLRRHGCKLPYMNVEGRECSTQREVKSIMRSLNYLFFNGHFNYSTCGCLPACYSVIYRRNTDTTWNNNKNAVMKVYLGGTSYEEVVEAHSYSSSDLVSRIGSFMGLLLGASILSVLQAIELILHQGRRALYCLLFPFSPTGAQ